jgi:hypothetical protein
MQDSQADSDENEKDNQGGSDNMFHNGFGFHIPFPAP